MVDRYIPPKSNSLPTEFEFTHETSSRNRSARLNPPKTRRSSAATAAKKKKAPSGRGCEDAVLVLGGTGKTGQRVVKALLKEGRDVVVAARSKESAAEIYGARTRGLFVQVFVHVPA